MQTYEIVRKRVEMYLFLRRIFPLRFNSELKKDSGFNQPYFPKNFFGFPQPGNLGHLLCLRQSQSECVARVIPILSFLLYAPAQWWEDDKSNWIELGGLYSGYRGGLACHWSWGSYFGQLEHIRYLSWAWSWISIHSGFSLHSKIATYWWILTCHWILTCNWLLA